MEIEFVDEDITAWGGLGILKRMFDRLKFDDVLAEAGLPTQGSNRGYSPVQILEAFIIATWCGASRFEHTEILRQDEVVKKMFGWSVMPGHRAYFRYFEKFTQAINERCFDFLYKWFLSQLIFDNYTLDFDSSVITRWGEQAGAAKGYNPAKPGRKSHHPLIAFLPDCRMIANCWLRPGNTVAMSNFVAFFHDTLQKMSGRTVGLVRADSGFFDGEIFKLLENYMVGGTSKPINYVIAAKLNSRIKYNIVWHQKWMPVENAPGISIAETTYKADDWDEPRRLVIVREKVDEKKDAQGKMIAKLKKGDLFPETYSVGEYRYSCYVTNLTLPPAEVWRLYRGRADSENRIKEMKYDFALDKFNSNNFWATEATMNFIVMAYNLMSLMRIAIINEPKKQRMSTLRYKMLAMPAYFAEPKNTAKLSIALPKQRRHAFLQLWGTSATFKLPVNF